MHSRGRDSGRTKTAVPNGLCDPFWLVWLIGMRDMPLAAAQSYLQLVPVPTVFDKLSQHARMTAYLYGQVPAVFI